MNSRVLLLISLICMFIVIKVVWLLFDPRSLVERLKSYPKPKHLFLGAFDLISGLGLIYTTLYFPLPKTQFDTVIIIFGLLSAISGFILAIWARYTMKKYWLPAGDGHNREKQTKLITSGPFGFTRNPIYVGLLLFYIGVFISLRSYLIVLILFRIFEFYKVAKTEENLLEKLFGEKYLIYKAKVPRFL